MPDEGNAQGATGNQGGASGGQGGQQSQSDGQQSILTGQQNQTGGQAGTGSTGVDLGWRGDPMVPKMYRSHKVFKNIKGKNVQEALPTILKNYVEAQSYIGGSIRIPKQGDPPEKVQEFQNKVFGFLGRPEKPDGYQVDLPDIEGEPLNSGMVREFTNRAHQRGLTNTQLQFVLNEYANVTKAGLETYRNNQKEALMKLQEEWGPRFTRKSVLAQRIVREVGGQEVLDLLDKTGLGNHPVLVKFMADLGEWAAEDGLIRGDVQGIDGPESAKQKIAAIMADPKHPYHSSKDVGAQAHKDAVVEMQRLHQIAYGK